MSGQALSLQLTAAKRGLIFLESYDASDHNESRESIPLDAILALLEVVTESGDLSDEDHITLFMDSSAIDAGFAAASILGRENHIEAIPLVVRFFSWAEQDKYLWCFEQAREIIDSFDPGTAPIFLELALKPSGSESIRSLLIEGVEEFSKREPAVNGLLHPLILQGLNQARNNSPSMNSQVMMLAVQARMTEAAETIERAFSANLIDCGFAGDWEVIRKQLHVEGLGLPMPKRPVNSITNLRRNLGLGAFSSEPLISMGKVKYDAVQIYLQNASEAFSRSPEAKALFRDGRFLFGLLQFLMLGMEYLGKNVENMTPRDAEEMLLSIFPRKVSMYADESDKVIEELAAFWTFCDRVHDIEQAPAIAKRIKELRGEFHRAMSEPVNFGMAKSVVMAGEAAGYDMSTEEGLNEFTQMFTEAIGSSPASKSKSKRSRQSLKDRKKELAKKMKQRKKR